MPKIQGSVKMKNEHDQKYYDALNRLDKLDINDISQMRNIVAVKNGKVVMPFYDSALETMSVRHDEQKNPVFPHGELLKNRLASYIEDYDLYYYDKDDGVPKRITFTENENGDVKVSISNKSVDTEQIEPPERPQEIGLGTKILHWLTFTLYGKDEYERYDREMKNYENEMAKYERRTNDKEILVANKDKRIDDNRRVKELRGAREANDTFVRYRRNMEAVYGQIPHKIENGLDSFIDTIDKNTRYQVSDGITPEMAQNLIRIDLASPEIAKDNKTYLDDPDSHLTVAIVHSTEDVLAARPALDKRLANTMNTARSDVAQALTEYREKNDPDKLGKIIGKNTWGFVNAASGNVEGITSRNYGEIKNNGYIMDLLDTHPDILAAAKRNGLTEKTISGLRAQREIASIHERAIEARKILLYNTPASEEKIKNALADYILEGLANRIIIRAGKEREEKTQKIQEEKMNELMKAGDPNHASYASFEIAKASELHAESSQLYDAFGDKTQVEKLVENIKADALFQGIVNDITKEADPAKVMTDRTRVGKIMHNIESKFAPPAKQEAVHENNLNKQNTLEDKNDHIEKDEISIDLK